jgi:hypothetical protein
MLSLCRSKSELAPLPLWWIYACTPGHIYPSNVGHYLLPLFAGVECAYVRCQLLRAHSMEPRHDITSVGITYEAWCKSLEWTVT